MNFEGKVVLVTGSSRGIGAATIRKFASYGADIVINYINGEAEANKLALKLNEQYKVRTLILKCDVSKEEEVKKMIEKIIATFGKIDILVNNAGIAIDTTFEDKTVENFKKTLDINLIGTFLVSKYASKYMLINNYGRIINVSSTNGIDTNYVESLDYDASKAGVISLTRNLAKQFAPIINVNTVAPGWINTEMNKQIDVEEQNKYKEDILLGRFGEPEEIADTIVFLASSSANYINNAIIRVDGGELK